MVEENISQEFRLKHIDEARNRAKEIDEQDAQKGFYNAKLCLKEGKRQSDAFVSECQQNTNRLEKPIRKVQVNNFTTVNFLKKNKSKQALKLAEAKGTQDLFGRLLFLSFQQKIDISMVCQYPIVP